MANERPGLIGRKIGMTQLFDEDGRVDAVTVVQVGPCTIMKVKTEESKDGYNAIKLGFGSQKKQRINRPDMGQLKAAGLETVRVIREIRLTKDEVAKHEVGKVLNASDVFEAGKAVDVIGTSKGCGFAGVMKRYNFSGFERSHGVHEFFRHGGSIGTRLTPGFVFKGKKMPGHMGNARVTVQNLQVVKVDTERNLVFVRGGVPGPAGSVVVVRQAVKKFR